MGADGNGSPITGVLQRLSTSPVGSSAQKSLRALDSWLRSESIRLARLHRLGEADAEDVRARVLLEIAKRSQNRAWVDSVRNLEGYLFTCLYNGWITLWRRNQADAKRAERIQIEETVRTEAAFATAIVNPYGDEELDIEVARLELKSILNACIEEALRTVGNDEEREQRRQAIEQVLGLYAQTLSMEQILEEAGITPESTMKERATLRNRFQKRHERARKALFAATESLEERGELPAERAKRMRIAVGLLRRCQR